MKEDETERAMVERHIADGKAQLESQRRVLHRLEQAGAPTDLARLILHTYHKTQYMHEKHLARLIEEEDGTDPRTSARRRLLRTSTPSSEPEG